MHRTKLHALFVFFALALLLPLIALNVAHAQIPRIISYQGVAFGGGGQPVADTDHTYVLSLYISESGGSPIYNQNGIVATKDGYFALPIGPLPSTLPFDATYWLGIAIDGNQELPRTPLTTSPYALNAIRSDSASYASSAARLIDGAPGVVTSVNGRSGAVTLQGAGATTVTMNGNTITIRSDSSSGSSGGGGWKLDGNAGTIAGEHFIGTLDNRPFEIHVNETGFNNEGTSGRGRVLRFEGNGTSPNIIGGYHSNGITGTIVGATIAGGGSFSEENAVSSNFATVGGGKENIVSGENGTIAGGTTNTVTGPAGTIGGGSSNRAESNATTVGGGVRNRAKDWNATVAGGKENIAEGVSSTIAGGESNGATGLGVTIGGGIGNRVFGNYGTVGGGDANATSREHSTVGGGRYNDASGTGGVVAGGVSDTASGNYSAIAGGIANRAKGLYASVGGGEANQSLGTASAVSGGSLNVLEGDYSAILGGQGLTLKGDRSLGFLANTATVDKKMSISASNVAVLGNVDLWLANNDTAARQLRLYAPNSASGNFPGVGANYSSFQSGAQGSNIEYILPTLMGGTGDVLGIASVNGSRVALTWGGLPSDRGMKENFLAIDGEEVLNKFGALELGSWSYRGEGRRHYGVMAQDFHAAFGEDALGTIGSDTTVHVVDLAGVAYLAIQALEKRTDELKETQAALIETIQELKKAREEQEELRRRIEGLEERVGR